MIKYKIKIIDELKKKGFTPSRIKEGENGKPYINEQTLQNIRKEKAFNFATLDTLCKLLHKQPGQLLEWVPDQEEKETE